MIQFAQKQVRKNKLLKELKRITRLIIEDYSPEKIILFGSYAYGNPSEDSDIDLLIIKESSKRRIDRFCEVRKIIRHVQGISVQPVVFTKNELKKRLQIGDDFIKEILERGQVLYAQQ